MKNCLRLFCLSKAWTVIKVELTSVQPIMELVSPHLLKSFYMFYVSTRFYVFLLLIFLLQCVQTDGSSNAENEFTFRRFLLEFNFIKTQLSHKRTHHNYINRFKLYRIVEYLAYFMLIFFV